VLLTKGQCLPPSLAGGRTGPVRIYYLRLTRGRRYTSSRKSGREVFKEVRVALALGAARNPFVQQRWDTTILLTTLIKSPQDAD